MADVTECKTLEQSLKLLDERNAEATQKIELFRTNFVELTGMQPGQQVNAADVVRLVLRIWGEPKQ